MTIYLIPTLEPNIPTVSEGVVTAIEWKPLCLNNGQNVKPKNP